MRTKDKFASLLKLKLKVCIESKTLFSFIRTVPVIFGILNSLIPTVDEQRTLNHTTVSTRSLYLVAAANYYFNQSS
jgi:hypothetical protein